VLYLQRPSSHDATGAKTRRQAPDRRTRSASLLVPDAPISPSIPGPPSLPCPSRTPRTTWTSRTTGGDPRTPDCPYGSRTGRVGSPSETRFASGPANDLAFVTSLRVESTTKTPRGTVAGGALLDSFSRDSVGCSGRTKLVESKPPG
jgi:hypothetical protein